eukprot:scaffold6615_cov115-Skeletonema_dohrnii-CCMP3373.AAC.6
MSDHPYAAGDLCKAPPTAEVVTYAANVRRPYTQFIAHKNGNFKEVCFSCLEKERRVLILLKQHMKATKSGEDSDSDSDSNSDSDINSGGNSDDNCDNDDGNNSGNNGDDENNNNIAAASKRDSVDPWLEEVTFDELKNYDATILMATRYYVAGDRDTWKPVILTAMSIGVAGFPDPDKFKEVEEIANVTKRNTHAYLRSLPCHICGPYHEEGCPFP